MMKIAWTIQAQRRGIEILEYSQQEFGNKATDRLARTIEQKTLQLINNPFRGPVELIHTHQHPSKLDKEVEL